MMIWKQELEILMTPNLLLHIKLLKFRSKHIPGRFGKSWESSLVLQIPEFIGEVVVDPKHNDPK